MTVVLMSGPARGRISPGTVLNGIYEVDCLLASGGMGEVYKGHTIPGGDPVAIKVMLPDMAQNDAALALFRKEASALHNLHHPAIVRYYVFAIDPNLGRPYLAMEFVDGQALSELLRLGGPLTLEATVLLMRRIATGLQAAHEHGIIHRDVSPDNIIIPFSDVGRARIIDFGIARSTRPNDRTVIGSGFAGKHNYVSPEQIGLFGGEVSGRSDIYSLGLVLVEALTGQAIDMGGSQAEIVEKRRKVPDLGGIDLRIRPLLARMLQPNPDDRPDSMADVVEATVVPVSATAARPVGAQARVVGAPPDAEVRRRRLILAALLGGAVVVGGIVQAFFLLAPGPPPAMAPAPTLQGGADPAGLEPSKPNASVVQVEEIERYVDDYDGGDCFFATPTAVTSLAARIEGYGAESAPFQKLDDAFRRSIGFEAEIEIRQVTTAQCPVLSFLNRSRGGRGSAPRLRIGTTSVQNGEVLSGTIDAYGDRHVDLLLVSDQGAVQNITALLRPDVEGVRFDMRVQRTGETAAQPELLVAVAGSRTIEALQTEALQQANTASATRVFARALDEQRQTGDVAGVTVQYFKVGQ